MFESKYSNVLTVLLVIVIIAIIALLGFLGYDFYRKYYINNETEKFLEEYEDIIAEEEKENNETTQESSDNDLNELINGVNTTETNKKESSNSKKVTYKGFEVAGRIEIPKTNLKYPVLTVATKKAIETAVGIQYGPGLNKVGNTVIVGHNYRNGLFFSNNKKLAKNDKIYITDNSGTKIEYTIYNIYQTTPEDTDYMVRDTQGKKEISLSTCTDNSKARLIIWAKAAN